MIRFLVPVFGKVCQDFGAVLVECHGEDHVHLLVEPPKVPVSAAPPAVACTYLPRAPVVSAYFAASFGGTSLSTIRQYVE
jgi:putative transposase